MPLFDVYVAVAWSVAKSTGSGAGRSGSRWGALIPVWFMP